MIQALPIRIAPSLLACDFGRLAEEVRRAEEAGADWLHVDVMDGHFVPNLTIGPPVVEAIRKTARVPLDVHLMIADPVRYAEAFAKAGSNLCTFHVEAVAEPRRAIEAFREHGCKVGIALNPDTPAERARPFLGEVDLVLAMSVFPGFGGQKFREEALPKCRALRDDFGWKGDLEIDGGVNGETLPRAAEAGANVFVAGTAIFGSGDLRATIALFREAASRVGARR